MDMWEDDDEFFGEPEERNASAPERMEAITQYRGMTKEGAERRILTRYDSLMRSSTPELPGWVWRTILSAYAGVTITEVPDPRTEVLIGVMDSGTVMSGDHSSQDLHSHLVGLSAVECAAILDVNDRFWSKDPEAEAFIERALNG
ncbi:hypothetical protein [Caenispirillum salinarum]|uniref:hypothetical protein n=1 Tax=Caenispirillum salinarum TaxID=859058 RepID=UPI0012674364|nr:hypothetical protein [Caenispirillum salinarum]